MFICVDCLLLTINTTQKKKKPWKNQETLKKQEIYISRAKQV